MKQTYLWYRTPVNFFQDAKLEFLNRKFGKDIYLIYQYLKTISYNSEDGTFTIPDYQIFKVCDLFSLTEEEVKNLIKALLDNGLIAVVDDEKGPVYKMDYIYHKDNDPLTNAEKVANYRARKKALSVADSTTVTPRETERNSVTPRETERNSVTPRETERNSVTPRETERNSCLHRDRDIDIDRDKDIDININTSYEVLGNSVTPDHEKTEKSKIKKEKKQDNTPYEDVINLFNSICSNLQTVRNLSEPRKTAIRARFKDLNYSLENFKNYFEKISDSDFLNGFNNSGWKADFDWILKPANMIKIQEGNYNNHDSGLKNWQKSFIKPSMTQAPNPDKFTLSQNNEHDIILCDDVEF